MADEALKRFVKSYSPGQVIFSEGEEGEEMYIIQSGKVRVSKNFAGRPHVLAVLHKGDFFGEMAIVSRFKRTATVTALEAVELLVFDREGLVNMITKNARIGLSIIDGLCRRLQNSNFNIQQLVKKDEAGLIALYLHQLFQALPAGKSTLDLRQTLDEISLNLEIPRESIAAVIERLVAQGVLGVEGYDVSLKKPAELYAPS